RHLLLVAKTRRGKSTLMLRLAHHAMWSEPRRAVLLVDPHRDLAEAALGVVPRPRGDVTVFLDVADRARPFGLNLLDTGLGGGRFQQEPVNAVLSKIHRFEGSRAARHIVGQPASTVDPSAWLRGGGIVIVNTARGTVGDNAAALIGGTLLNLVTLAVAEQARLDPAARAPISILVDEFHTIPGADYEGILAELSKYGANLILATQSLARLLEP